MRIAGSSSFIACAALALGAAAGADDSLPAHPCAQLRDDGARLACYDHAFGKPGGEAPSAPPPELPQPPPQPQSLPPPAAEPQPPALDRFGFTTRQVERTNPAAEKPVAVPDRIQATVTAITYRSDGKFTATLDNGQVWSQAETNTKVRPAVGETVTVRRATLGSYLLTGRLGLATRARRVR